VRAGAAVLCVVCEVEALIGTCGLAARAGRGRGWDAIAGVAGVARRTIRVGRARLFFSAAAAGREERDHRKE
jgi:hypothetical protein